MTEPPQRTIPAVHRFTSDPRIAPYAGILGAGTVRMAIQSLLESVRSSTTAAPPFETLRDRLAGVLAAKEAEGLIEVINGTGVVLHTNFGRAPLSAAALDAVSRLAAGYTNLEYDLDAGARGSRYERLSSQLRELSGAEAALVVNNCAAAVLLVLDTFARGREVVVSRGQLIEIGGGFRLPDVLRKSGATLVEVGTTNKTYPADYRNAWTPSTAIFMRTHPSNYRVEGFVAEVDSRTLAELARELNAISFEDLGSGALVELAPFGVPHEPTLAEEVAAGLDLVAVSGDKLLGGPQCGIIAGRAELVDRLRRNPLLRALRVDKMTIAALGATLGAYLEADRLGELPIFAMLRTTQDELLTRARAIASRVSADVAPLSVTVTAVRTASMTGGGTLPKTELPSAGLELRSPGAAPEELAARLRQGRPPLIGRAEGDALVIDLRAIPPAQDDRVAELIAKQCTSSAPPGT